MTDRRLLPPARRAAPAALPRSTGVTSRSRSRSRPAPTPRVSPPPPARAAATPPLRRPVETTVTLPSSSSLTDRPPWQDVVALPAGANRERSPTPPPRHPTPPHPATTHRTLGDPRQRGVRTGNDAPAPVPGTAAAAAATTNLDDRPIVARGFYDLDFFDGDNEYESYGLEVMERDERRFQGFFQHYLAHLGSDAVTDDDFDREWTYERLLELDAQLVKRGGLTSAELRKLLTPKRGIVTDCCICMEQSKRHEKMAQLTCGHAFHVACLQEWLGQNYTCPLCRHDLRDTKSRAVDNVVGDSDDEVVEAPVRRPPPPRRGGGSASGGRGSVNANVDDGSSALNY